MKRDFDCNPGACVPGRGVRLRRRAARRKNRVGGEWLMHVKFEGDLRGPWGPYVSDSVGLANEHLAEKGKRFYFSEIDVFQKVIGGVHCCDMFGWVVADEDADEFEPMWLADDYEGMERFDYAIVEWREESGKPVPVFDTVG